MNKGFTLVELLVTTLIFSFMLMCFYSVLNVGRTHYFIDIGLIDLQEQERNALDRIVREVRASSATTITTISSTSDRISFNIPGSTGIQYFLSGAQLIRQDPNGLQRIIAYNITRLKFTATGTLLQIQLQADQTVLSKALSVAMTEEVRLRNE